MLSLKTSTGFTKRSSANRAKCTQLRRPAGSATGPKEAQPIHHCTALNNRASLASESDGKAACGGSEARALQKCLHMQVFPGDRA